MAPLEGGIDFSGTVPAQAAVGATFISAPGQPSASTHGAPGAPGSGGMGASMQVHQAAMLLIFGSLATLVVIGYVFRRGPIKE